MEKYIRTKDGKIFDLEKIKSKLKSNPYYKNYRFSKLKTNKLRNEIILNYSAIGCKGVDKDQLDRRCRFEVSLDCDSLEYIESDTIEELLDSLIYIKKDGHKRFIYDRQNLDQNYYKELLQNGDIYAAIWTEWGLKYVAEMKGILPNGEIDWKLI